MVERVWFRLLIRALGVLFLGLSLPTLISLASNIVSALMASNSSPFAGRDWTIYYIGTGLGYSLQAALGVYLLFFAEGLIRKCITDTLGRCPMCQYDLQGQKGDTCPECGTPFRTIVATSPTTKAPTVSANSGTT